MEERRISGSPGYTSLHHMPLQESGTWRKIEPFRAGEVTWRKIEPWCVLLLLLQAFREPCVD